MGAGALPLPLTIHVEDGRQAQALLVRTPVGLVVGQLTEEGVGVTQGFHDFFHHIELGLRALEEL